MNMRKIAWITPTAYLDTDIYIVEQLAKHYNIDWYIINRKNDKLDYFDTVERLSNAVNLQIVSIGVRHRDFETLRQYWRLGGMIKSRNYDAVYSSVANFPYFIPVLALRVPRKNVILAVHNVSKVQGGVHPILHSIYNKLAFSLFHHFHTFSESQHKAALEIAPRKDIRKVSFIPKNYGTAQTKRTDNSITFLNFGLIRRYKRLDVLILAAEKAYANTGIPFKVIIAGNCDDWSFYSALIKNDFLFDIRLGHVQNSDIPNLFELSDYFVMPYQSIAQSGAMMVAVNYEKPIIASRLEAFEECITTGENGILIEPANVDALANAFTYVLTNHADIYPHLKKNMCTVKNDKYSISSITKNYCDFIDSIILRNK